MIDFSVVVCNYNILPQMKVVAMAFRGFPFDFELILADDHSDDGSVEWAEKSGLFDKIYVKPVREYYCINTIRNESIGIATNEHVILVDSSNVPVATFFDSHSETLEKHPDCLSAGPIIRCEVEYDCLDIIRNRDIAFKEEKIVPVTPGGVMGGNMAFSKKMWNSIGRFDQQYNGCWGYDDNDFAIRSIIHGYGAYMHRDSVALHLDHKVSWERQAHGTRNLDILRGKFGNLVEQLSLGS
jgi:GT2 family glycosyltransferase